MTRVVIAGAGAFGTALALTLHRAGRDVVLCGRDVAGMIAQRKTPRLSGVILPDDLHMTDHLTVTPKDVLLLAVPMQSIGAYLAQHQPKPRAAIACCKGVDLKTGLGPTALIARHLDCPSAILTGPSFAIDIANGLPTALTLATTNCADVQTLLATDALRIYLSDDPVGAELGGALKNVIAIACGICIGAGFGESARAALMTRGFAEMQRLAAALGAQPQTLSGLSGFGDLALTCTSTTSRNFSFGHALGSGGTAPDATTEGRATAQAVVTLAQRLNVDMPIAKAVADMVSGDVTPQNVLETLFSRPLRKE